MFSLYCEYRTYDSQQQQYISHNDCFYDDSIPDKSYIVLSPTLEKEVGTSGSLSFVLPPTNIGYNSVSRDACELVCYKQDDEIWRGRILSDDSDFYNQRSIKCEGVLSYLNDVIIPANNYGEMTYYQMVNDVILAIYNGKNGNDDQNPNNFFGPYDKRIYMGEFPGGNNAFGTLESDNNNALELIDSIAEACEVYPTIERRNSKNYLVFIKGTKHENGRFFDTEVEGQEIIFGENLLDFTKSYDVTNLITAVTMRGSRLDGEEGDQYYTLEALDRTGSGTQQDPYVYTDRTDPTTGIVHIGGKTYIYHGTSINSYGWRETTLEIETTGTEEEVNPEDRPSWQLWTVGVNYLKVSQFDTMVIEVTAVDLTYLGVDADSLDIYKDIKVESIPHGLNRYFPITSISIPLDDPTNTTYKMGVQEDISLSNSYNKTNQELLNKINDLPKESDILNAAKQNASDLIRNAVTGHITITQGQTGQSDSLVISKGLNPTTSGSWVFNSGGLGYWPNGWSGPGTSGTVIVAITNDGHITADAITTGVMSANRIQGGELKLINLDAANGDYVILNIDAFEGKRFINNSYLTSFVIKPMDGTITYVDPNNNSTTLGNIVRYSSIVHKFECEDLWVSGATTGNDGSIVPTAYSMQGMGSYVNRSGYAASDMYSYLYNGSTGRRMNASFISHGSYGGASGDVPLWRVPIGGRYLSFYHGILVQDEPIDDAWTSIGMTSSAAAYNDANGTARDIYYTGNITVGNDTWKVINGLIVGQVQNNNP